MKRILCSVMALAMAAPLFFSSCEKDVKSSEIPIPEMDSVQLVLNVGAIVKVVGNDVSVEDIPQGATLTFSCAASDLMQGPADQTITRVVDVSGQGEKRVWLPCPRTGDGVTYSVLSSQVIADYTFEKPDAAEAGKFNETTEKWIYKASFGTITDNQITVKSGQMFKAEVVEYKATEVAEAPVGSDSKLTRVAVKFKLKAQIEQNRNWKNKGNLIRTDKGAPYFKVFNSEEDLNSGKEEDKKKYFRFYEFKVSDFLPGAVEVKFAATVGGAGVNFVETLPANEKFYTVSLNATSTGTQYSITLPEYTAPSRLPKVLEVKNFVNEGGEAKNKGLFIADGEVKEEDNPVTGLTEKVFVPTWDEIAWVYQPKGSTTITVTVNADGTFSADTMEDGAVVVEYALKERAK